MKRNNPAHLEILDEAILVLRRGVMPSAEQRAQLADQLAMVRDEKAHCRPWTGALREQRLHREEIARVFAEASRRR